MDKAKNLLFSALSLFGFLYGNEQPPNDQAPPIGNFSVPFVSQIAPLVSFGQLLVGEKALLNQFAGSYTQGHNSFSDYVAPSVVYGITNEFSVFFGVPFFPKSGLGSSRSSGIADLFLQLEYGFFTKNTSDYSLQATLVGNVQFPTGSRSKTPRTGNGSFTYFAGATLAYMSADWYAFVSPGADLTTTRHGTKFGNSYFYQWGFAKYIEALSPSGAIFDLMIEFDGTFSEKDRIHGAVSPNSGGNTILVTPSIWMSSKNWILQLGVGFPIVQDLNGQQDKIRYSIAYNLGWAIQF